MFFNIFTELCNHHHVQLQDISITLQRNLVSIYSHSPYPSQPLATTHLFLTMDLPIPDILHKCNHTICGLLCLVSLTQCNVFIHVAACINTSLLFNSHCPVPNPLSSLSQHQPLLYFLSVQICLFWTFHINRII